MLLARIEKLDDDYIVRIPRDEIVQRDLRAGQVVTVVIEAFDEYATLDVEPAEQPADTWKLNEPRPRYRPSD